MSFDRIAQTTGLLHKIKFYYVYGKMLLLLSHFLVEEDYELYQSTSHCLSVPLPLEYVRIITLSFFSISCLPDDFLCKIVISTVDTTFNSTCDKAFDLS